MERSKKNNIEYEQAVSELHNVANELARMDSQADVCHRIIDAAETLLDFGFSIIAFEEDGQLCPQAVSSEMEPDEFDTMSIHDGVAGKAYRTGESILIENLTEHEEAEPKGPWMSAISLPVGEFGNFQAVDEEIGAFSEQDLQLAELLITHASHHLSRIADKEELQRRNDRLEEFASVVSHDLRNPLSVAEGRLELAREECDSEHLDGVAQAHDRMRSLIDDLLTLGRTGDTVSELEPVDLANLTADCWENVDTAGASFTTEIDRQILADRSLLHQLFENLIRNAIDHCSPDVTVTIGELDNGFYFEDDGPGIADEERDAIFDLGYSTTENGTGFGLSIVEQVTYAHGWDIRVTDSSLGGARFEITGAEFVPE